MTSIICAMILGSRAVVLAWRSRNALGSFGQHEAREDAMHLAHIPLLDLGIVFALSKGDMLSESNLCPSGT